MRRSAAEWRALIDRRERSGLSRLAFCREEGVPRTSLEKWERRLAVASSSGRFVELTRGPEAAGIWELEVRLPDGAILRFRGVVDAAVE